MPWQIFLLDELAERDCIIGLDRHRGAFIATARWKSGFIITPMALGGAVFSPLVRERDHLR